MTVVLVHGVPETPAIWEPLRAHLNRTDVRALQLPGFGCPRPAGFGSTKEEYVAWLAAELESMAGDRIDLVGHDWGGALVVRLVSTRPELVTTWTTDAVAIGHPDFRWHDLARLWQSPGAGEEYFERQSAMPPEQQAEALVAAGVPGEHARTLVAAADRVMADSILSLYRSAVDVAREWSPAFTGIPAPGLALLPSLDPFVMVELGPAAAARAGAETAHLPGLGHWWMLEDPAAGAARLAEFWSRAAK